MTMPEVKIIVVKFLLSNKTWKISHRICAGALISSSASQVKLSLTTAAAGLTRAFQSCQYLTLALATFAPLGRSLLSKNSQCSGTHDRSFSFLQKENFRPRALILRDLKWPKTHDHNFHQCSEERSAAKQRASLVTANFVIEEEEIVHAEILQRRILSSAL